jgi:gluconolactonase
MIMALFQRDYFSPLVSGLDHPEGVAYGPDGYVYAGGEAGQVYRISLDGKCEQFASTGGFCLGIACDALANAYVCDAGHSAVMRVTSSGQASVYSDRCAGVRMTSPNYLCFDGEANLYVSDSGGHRQANGKIYVVRPGGVAELFSTEAHVFTNGMCLSPDGRALYVVESELPGVCRIPILASGKAGGREPVLSLPDSEVPDGLAFDAMGNLYISCYQPNRVYRLSQAGALEVVVDDPTGLFLAMTTNIAFGGPDLDRLLIANLGGWHIAHGAIGVQGARLHYPMVG